MPPRRKTRASQAAIEENQAAAASAPIPSSPPIETGQEVSRPDEQLRTSNIVESQNSSSSDTLLPSSQDANPDTSTTNFRPINRPDPPRSNRGNLYGPSSSNSAAPRLKFQPRFSARRTQAERDAQEAAEIERQRQRAWDTSRGYRGSSSRGRWGGRARGRGRGMFRGGLSGWTDEMRDYEQRRIAGQATGLFSGPTREEAAAAAANLKRSSRAGRAGRGERTARSEVRSEPSRPSDAGDSARGDSKSAGRSGKASSRKATGGGKEGTRKRTRKGKEAEVKEEEGAKDEDFEEGDQSDVEDEDIDKRGPVYIDLVSEDEPEEGAAGPSEQQRGDTSQDYVNWHLNPVRLSRKGHIKRAVGVSTESSSTAAAQIRQKAKEAGVSTKEVTIVSDGKAVAPKVRAPKGKGKQKEVEFIKDGKKWQGVFEDEETAEPKIKVEDEDVQMTDVGPVAATDTATQVDGSATQPPEADEAATPEALLPQPVKPKRRILSHHFNKPTLQTEEDRQEWERYKADLAALAEEFTQANLTSNKDRDDDTYMGEDGQEGLKDRRKNMTYLFQLPPILPNLVTKDKAKKLSEVKAKEIKEREDAATNLQKEGNSKVTQQKAGRGVPSGSTQAGAQIKIKREDGTKDHLVTDQPRPEFNANIEEEFTGPVGTLSVYESGATALDWGGIEFELQRGIGTSLQTLVVMNQGESVGGRKAASAMGDIAGTLIVTPAWEKLFAPELDLVK